mmetsp:Transcript_34115/g.75034  ORF Transcript_34115/g.75034 Transcript_34115/m.75034 type:complete len:243 (-) Transcript_34115:1536-2264(-)
MLLLRRRCFSRGSSSLLHLLMPLRFHSNTSYLVVLHQNLLLQLLRHGQTGGYYNGGRSAGRANLNSCRCRGSRMLLLLLRQCLRPDGDHGHHGHNARRCHLGSSDGGHVFNTELLGRGGRSNRGGGGALSLDGRDRSNSSDAGRWKSNSGGTSDNLRNLRNDGTTGATGNGRIICLAFQGLAFVLLLLTNLEQRRYTLGGPELGSPLSETLRCLLPSPAVANVVPSLLSHGTAAGGFHLLSP